ncbi:MAG: sugar nucleotide-binding protein, partial [Rhodospirillaceae bacterium]
SGCRYVILRTAWVYGVHGHNFVKTMLRLGRERDTLRVVDDQRGCPTFAPDLADAVVSVAAQESAASGSAASGIYHCVGGGSTTWCGFARKIFDIVRRRGFPAPAVEAIKAAEYRTPAPRPANSVLDCSKLQERYGLALRPWEDALEDMLKETLSKDGDQM